MDIRTTNCSENDPGHLNSTVVQNALLNKSLASNAYLAQAFRGCVAQLTGSCQVFTFSNCHSLPNQFLIIVFFLISSQTYKVQ